MKMVKNAMVGGGIKNKISKNIPPPSPLSFCHFPLGTTYCGLSAGC
jgi:hypothetical protein